MHDIKAKQPANQQRLQPASQSGYCTLGQTNGRSAWTSRACYRLNWPFFSFCRPNIDFNSRREPLIRTGCMHESVANERRRDGDQEMGML
ncbi:unnamed protein product [Protopolystoma xenopodis]|uniref:Uncharacterized protein n=1 Tax=Protopolystoma xenopodis TaxID=117903 RepID=A0A3S5CVZ1_9PLAT|nr:unnamed protein product [Protopolystoma xenopodis]